MELKDVILSTLAEMEETDTLKEEVQTQTSSTETFFEATSPD
ncbi:MAG: hypothetical protein Q9M40_10070 [Sulfurimonas sp.]|nr:hypothetical protein [Sulfurimonas sp.]